MIKNCLLSPRDILLFFVVGLALLTTRLDDFRDNRVPSFLRGGGTGRRARYKKGPQVTGCNPAVIKLRSKQLVGTSKLPRNWTKTDIKGYYAFLDRSLDIYRRGKYNRNRNLDQKVAIKELTQIYERMCPEERTKWAFEHADPYAFSWFPVEEEGDTTYIEYTRPHALNKLKKYNIELPSWWQKKFLLHKVYSDFHNWKKLAPNNTFIRDYKGRRIPLSRRQAERFSMKEFDNWITTNEDGANFRLPSLPDITDKEADEIVRYLTRGNSSIKSAPSGERPGLRYKARQAAQIALTQGSGYLLYKMSGSLAAFEKHLC
mmetsp:Transcript_13007/g.20860  ORF Transcript_13007/g.20860 Transcript_13007/m.20860 type:complete len:317 (+) Transcript_13007:103-1053(+)|eukprot:jgi/Bigna1/66216/fgenesh1_pg.1_\